MFDAQKAISPCALQSLIDSYNLQWNGVFSMYSLITLWITKKSQDCKKVNIRAYYAYQRKDGSIGYWNGKFIYNTCKNTYKYILGSGSYASASYNGLTVKQENKLKAYFYNPKAYPLNFIFNNIVQFTVYF